jgi:D-alanyl-D-alanine carboxypeptidase/D-alanyl-D-alanine-endopeptidase (penicillin-binding protein 4)
MTEPGLDVVTGPVRYRRGPFVALIACAAVPAVALTALLVWSDEQADEHAAALAVAPDDAPSAAVVDAPASPELATGLLAFRRIPDQVATVGDDAVLADDLDELTAFVDDRSCLAVSVDGRAVLDHNATTPVIPASVHKLFVAAVALEVLGPDHRFTTSVLAPAPVDGVVDGDLVLVGGGDPLLVSADYPIEDDRFPAFNTSSLDALADAVAAAGVTTITGVVLGDGSRYDDEFVIPTWGPNVAFVEAGPYGALVVNDARTLGRTGRQRDPNEAAAREFRRLLTERGVQSGRFGVGVADGSMATIATIESAPLTDVVAEMLTTSDNDTAEMLLKELGVADIGAGTVAAGLNVVDRTLRSWEIPMDGVRLADASGLSSTNRATCAAVLALLARVAGSPVAEGLAVAGRTGTLQGEFLGTPVEGRLVAKTGTLGNPPDDLDPPAAKGLAGYLTAESGSTIEFVMLLNGPTIDDEDFYQPLWDALADRLASYPAGPEPATVGPLRDE